MHPLRVCPGRGGGTPLYKRYRYLPTHRVAFLRDSAARYAILGVIGFATGHIVEQEQRAVLPLSPITRQQHGNLVFIVGTHGLYKPIVAQQIFIGFRASQL